MILKAVKCGVLERITEEHICLWLTVMKLGLNGLNAGGILTYFKKSG